MIHRPENNPPGVLYVLLRKCVAKGLPLLTGWVRRRVGCSCSFTSIKKKTGKFLYSTKQANNLLYLGLTRFSLSLFQKDKDSQLEVFFFKFLTYLFNVLFIKKESLSVSFSSRVWFNLISSHLHFIPMKINFIYSFVYSLTKCSLTIYGIP